MTDEDEERYRRRRAVAGLALLAILALLITAISSHGDAHRHRATPDPVAHHAVAARPTPAAQQALTHAAEEKAIDSVLADAAGLIRALGEATAAE